MEGLNKQNSVLPYRRGVGMVVFNKEGKVFAGRRIVKNVNPEENLERLWQFPQGGIDNEEEPLEAAYRELYEETGMRSLCYLAHIDEWLHYDFPSNMPSNNLKTIYKGQQQKWFAFRFTGSDSEIAINPPPGGHMVEFDRWGWFDLNAMADYIVHFKYEVYKIVIEKFKFLAAS